MGGSSIRLPSSCAAPTRCAGWSVSIASSPISARRWCWLTSQAEDVEAIRLGLRIGGSIWWYMHVRGTYVEIRDLVLPLLEASHADAIDKHARARAHGAPSVWPHGDWATMRPPGVCTSRKLSPSFGRAATSRTHARCWSTCRATRLPRATSPPPRQSPLRHWSSPTAVGDEWMSAWALTFQGMLAIAEGDLASAKTRLDSALRLRRQIGDLFGQAWASHGLASVERIRGDAASARPLYEDALITFRALGERPTVASILDGLGELALAERDFGEARDAVRRRPGAVSGNGQSARDRHRHLGVRGGGGRARAARTGGATRRRGDRPASGRRRRDPAHPTTRLDRPGWTMPDAPSATQRPRARGPAACHCQSTMRSTKRWRTRRAPRRAPAEPTRDAAHAA